MFNVRLHLFLLCCAGGWFTGCSLDPFNASAYLPPADSSKPTSPSTPDNPAAPDAFFIEIRMKGESSAGYFYQAGAGAYPNGVEFQIMHLDRVYAAFVGSYGDEGFHAFYGFADSLGNTFDVRRYISDPVLKTPPKSATLNLYYWIKKKAYLFGRNDLSITVPAARYDASIHTNIARFTVTAYPDHDDLRPDLVVFDGFVPK